MADIFIAYLALLDKNAPLMVRTYLPSHSREPTIRVDFLGVSVLDTVLGCDLGVFLVISVLGCAALSRPNNCTIFFASVALIV